jgi:hypothetical protein
MAGPEKKFSPLFAEEKIEYRCTCGTPHELNFDWW